MLELLIIDDVSININEIVNISIKLEESGYIIYIYTQTFITSIEFKTYEEAQQYFNKLIDKIADKKVSMNDE